MRIFNVPVALAALIAGATLASAQTLSNYSTAELVSPCQLADSDAREQGQAAETECEQYIIGYVDALEATGLIGEATAICLPEQNIADEVRWAFMRWVHADYGARTSTMAANALLETMQEAFPCP